MKQTYIILFLFFSLFLYGQYSHAQFVVAQDTIRGRIDFCPRPGDLTNRILVPNDSVFYMYPPDLEIDPWRYVDFYTPERSTRRGYIRGTDLMRIDDYEMIEVEKLSSHGTVSFKDKDVRVDVAVTAISTKDISTKQNGNKFIINGKYAKGVSNGRSPRLKYRSISVSIKGRNIVFPKKVYEHLLEPEIDNMAVYYNTQKQIVYILADNGGSGAPYKVLWTVSPKGVLNVYIFDPSLK